MSFNTTAGKLTPVAVLRIEDFNHSLQGSEAVGDLDVGYSHLHAHSTGNNLKGLCQLSNNAATLRFAASTLCGYVVALPQLGADDTVFPSRRNFLLQKLLLFRQRGLVRCNLGLTEIPQDIPNDTRRLYLDYNLLTAIPANAFHDLPLLTELDLSHNELAQLEPGAFRGLAGSLQFLDLASNQITTLDPDAFEGVKARSNLTGNPWHCDCRLQTALPHLNLEPMSLTGIICQTSEPADSGAQGVPFLLANDLDLCVVLKKTTDVAMLVTMFGWFTMVISYLVYYVRHNQEDARRHLEYLKSLPSRQGKSEESSTISTVV
ncbi:Leucine-rich repeat-containing protein 3B [Triplophysa tibetana]|uniref:Leucine-rich repeat-containing protein 3B n=1 Tax=Triplophysa tibetana TaxID=1572043 RepID=A0A5A9PYY7_9TELE|nr:Leucine-rich repeat-containing protein 3B [Triplophysa tibetana]